MTNKKVTVKFLKESIEFKSDDNPMSILLLSVMGAFAEFERSIILERQREGIAIAKTKGVYKGRKDMLSAEQVDAIKQKLESGMPKSLIAKKWVYADKRFIAILARSCRHNN